MTDASLQSLVSSQTALRRTFAIISHPDAGKTTLTEKLLLYSGMVRTAGMVRGRKGGKATSSDWMAMEQERGISITASAMQFPYKGTTVNLLDTPGHQDFSEDTYRTLTAADSAVMVIDAAKGVETQTRKLFAVCRMRAIPILTFINKMDLPTRDPFDLMHEVEEVLGIKAAPLNWPIGTGREFAGVVDCRTFEVSLFKRSAQGGSSRAEITQMPLEEFKKQNLVDADVLAKLAYELELLSVAGNQFDDKSFLRGEVTPVFFGSALTNFGVEPFFDNFVALAPSPRETLAIQDDGNEVLIDPTNEHFSAFIFKIQANMNPKHRDSMAFMRVCSGRFEREMTVKHHRLNKEIRLARSYSLVAQDRNTVESAFPGDIVGVINPGAFAIGDTISEQGGFNFKGMPQFSTECVAQIRPKEVMKHKAFEKGLKQLLDEGAVQLLRSYDHPEGAPMVAAVGRLQFEVLQYRLKSEYNVETQIDVLPYQESAWLIGDPRELRKPQSAGLALDVQGRVVVLFTGAWERKFVLERNPQHQLKDFAH
ncbi:MAG: peptide chain release factor 3 [Deltaproteobacteria bacterium]|nr:peptide chain release factor 3 [Deltaproteobacteria bacterium]